MAPPDRQNFQRRPEILRQRRLKAHGFPGSRMHEGKFARVQHHTRRFVAGQFRELLVLPRAIGFVARQRMAEELEMHADLMGAARVQLRLHQRGGIQPLEHAPARVRRATGMVVADGHAFAMRRMPRNGGTDFTRFTREFAAHDGDVDFFDLPSGKLGGKRHVRFIIFGHDQAAAGFLVEPVDNARARDAADAAEFAAAMMQQRVDERMFLVSGGGMHNQPGGFVQYQQRLVLKKNVERDFLRLRAGGPGFRPVNFNCFTGARRMRRFDRPAVDTNVTFFNQSFQRDPRDRGKFPPQKHVQPLGRERFFDSETFRARGIST